MDNYCPISEFDALARDEVLELLVQCISQLSPTQKTILALYYHGDLEPAEIAACVGLTEGELDQVRAETVGLLRTMLAAQIGLLELPASFDSPHDADGADVLVNG
jgi:DNA-directed RNA polymerase specialized sigma24 family protein